MAQLRRLRQQFPEQLVVIGVHSAKFPTEKLTANLREAVMRHGIDHPVVNDADFNIWQQYAIKAWPTVVLINPVGKIVHTQSGEILADDFVALIQILLNEFMDDGVLSQTPLALVPERLGQPERMLNYPSKLLPGPNNQLFIADTGHHRILEVALQDNGTVGQIIQTFGGNGPGFQDGTAADAQFHDPHGMSLFDTTLYVADTENHAVRAIDLSSGIVRTVAGIGQKAHGRFVGDSPRSTPLRSPWAVWAQDNIVLIAMAGSHQIWALVAEDRLGVFAGNGAEALVDGSLLEASFNQPSDLDAGFGYMFIADAEASAIRAISMGNEPFVMTLVGQGLFEFGDVDGSAGEVRLQHPTGLTFYNGLIYIADSYNHKIKTLDPTTAEVKTLIGTGQPGATDGPFTEAELYEPEGLVAVHNQLYIADTNNHVVRVANLETGRLHTLDLQ